MISNPQMKRWNTLINMVQGYVDVYDDTGAKIILHLDNDIEYLKVIKRYTKGDDSVMTISDTDEFQAFVLQNHKACTKMYIDIRIGLKNGIDLAEELKLDGYFSELIFVSEATPSDEDMKRIEALGGIFMNKGELLDKIIYPREG